MINNWVYIFVLQVWLSIRDIHSLVDIFKNLFFISKKTKLVGELERIFDEKLVKKSVAVKISNIFEYGI